MVDALTRPPILRAGDRVAVVAPSAPVDRTRLGQGVRLLQSWGLQVTVGRHAVDRAHGGMVAGADEDRAADLEEAWLDPQVAAVFAARGGYGATRLLPLLDWAAWSRCPPKWLVGFSDVTALHALVGQRLGLQSIHGPMPASQLLAGPDPDQYSSGRLRGELMSTGLRTLRGDPGWCWGRDSVPGPVSGRLVGGNLAVLAALAGTGYLPSAAGSVVLVEDVDESPYRVDRMLTQLRQCRWFDDAVAVVLGGFSGCGALDTLRTCLGDRVATLGLPVLGGLRLGHERPQASVPLGSIVTVDVAGCSLSWSSVDASRRSSRT